MKSVVIIPTYNERENINTLIKEIFTFLPDLDVLVVDDNSPDGTGRIIDNLSKANRKIQVIHRLKKLGLSSAYKDGFQWVLERNYDCVFQMDADLSHHPKYLSEMLDRIKTGADLVIGSRYKGGLRTEDWSLFRLVISFVANFYTRIFLAIRISDFTSGFRCFRVEALRNINLNEIRSKGYAFQIEMAYLCNKNKYSIQEVPITFFGRRMEKSKFTIKIAIEAFFTVLRLGFEKLMSKVILLT